MATIFGKKYPDNAISKMFGVDVSGLLAYPTGFATDSAGNVFIGNYDDNTLSVVCPVATTLYGKSFAANVVTKIDLSGSENLSYPGSLTFDKAGNLIILDYNNGIAILPKTTTRFFDISCAANTITLIGTDFSGTVDYLGYGYFKGIAIDSRRRIFFGTAAINNILILSQTDTTIYGEDISKNTVTRISTFIGGSGLLAYPKGLAFDSSGNLLIGNSNDNTISILCPRATTVYGIERPANVITSLMVLPGSDLLNRPGAFAIDAQGNLFIGSNEDTPICILPRTDMVISNVSCPANTITQLDSLDIGGIVDYPHGLGFDISGNLLIGSNDVNYISVLPYVPRTNLPTIFGKKYPDNAMSKMFGVDVSGLLALPTGFATDSSGNVFIGNYNDNTLSVVCPVATTLYGKSFAANVITKIDLSGSANLSAPGSLTFDKSGNLIILDYDNGIAILPKTTTTFIDIPCTENEITFVVQEVSNNLSIALDPNENIFFISNNTVKVLCQTDTYLYGKTVPKNIVNDLNFFVNTDILLYNKGLTFDSAGNLIISGIVEGPSYVCILSNNYGPVTIYGIECQALTITSLMGLPGSNINPRGILIDTHGNLIIADNNNDIVVLPKLDTVIYNVSCPANTFTSLQSLDVNYILNAPFSLGLDKAGNILIGSQNGNYISVLPNYDNTVVSIFGGEYSSVGISKITGVDVNNVIAAPTGFVTDASGNVFIGNYDNSKLSVLCPVATTLYGVSCDANVVTSLDLPGSENLTKPNSLALDKVGNLIILDSEVGIAILPKTTTRFFDISCAANTITLIGFEFYGTVDYLGYNEFKGLALDSSGRIFFGTEDTDDIFILSQTDTTMYGENVSKNTLTRISDLVDDGGLLDSPTGLAFDSSGNLLIGNFNSDGLSILCPRATTIYGIDCSANKITSLMDLPGSDLFNFPDALSFDAQGNLFIGSDADNQLYVLPRMDTEIYNISMPANVITPLYILDINSIVDNPYGLGFDKARNLLIGSSTENYISVLPYPPRSRLPTVFGKKYPDNAISKIFGVDASGLLANPTGFATDSSGNVFIGNYDDNTLSVVCPVATTLYGKSFAANVVTKIDLSGSENLTAPGSLTFDKVGNLIILDYSRGIAILPKTTTRFFDISCAANTITMIGTDFSGTVDFSEQGNFKGIAIDSSGRIFFGSDDYNDIFILSQTATKVYGEDISKNTVIPISNLMNTGSFNNPTGLAFDSSGNLLIGNYSNGGISILCPRVTKVYGIDCSANKITSLMNVPSSSAGTLVFDNSGNLFISSRSYDNLYILPRTDRIIYNISCPANDITMLASLDLDGNINSPFGFGFDKAGNLLIGSDSENYISVLPFSKEVLPLVVPGLAGSSTSLYDYFYATESTFLFSPLTIQKYVSKIPLQSGQGTSVPVGTPLLDTKRRVFSYGKNHLKTYEFHEVMRMDTRESGYICVWAANGVIPTSL